MARGFCQYHKQEETLCKAHILPRAFYRRVADVHGEGFWIAGENQKHAKRAHAGLYDPSILCGTADSEFGIYDKYAVEFFSTAIPKTLHCTADGREWFKISAFDFHRLTLFLLSYIWRCHHSKLDTYEEFAIGDAFEERIIEKLKYKDSSPVHWIDYIVTIFYSNPRELIFSLKLPSVQKVDGLNFLFLYFLNFKVIVKLDARPTPNWLRFAAAVPGKVLVAPAVSYRGSTEHRSDLNSLQRLLSRDEKS